MSKIERENFSEYDITSEEFQEKLENKRGRILWEEPARLVKEMTEEDLAKGPEDSVGRAPAEEIERQCVLRYATKEDFDGLKAVDMDRWRLRAKEYNSEDNKRKKVWEPRNEDELKRYLSEDSKASHLVLAVDGQIAGYIAFGKNAGDDEKYKDYIDDTTVRVYTLSVLEKFQKNGFGAALLEHGILEAEKNFGAEKIFLNTQAKNEGSMKLYTAPKKGFEFKEVKREQDTKRDWMKWNKKKKTWEERKNYRVSLMLDIEKWKAKKNKEKIKN